MPAQHILRTLLNDTCSLMHQARRQALEVTVMAALSGARLTVTALGRAIASRAKQKHCIKRADRLLSNPHVHRERSAIYAELVRRLIGGCQRPIILVDWSDLDDCKRHFLLRAAGAVKGRSFTLYEEVHTIQTKEKPQSHRHFLRTLKGMLAADCSPLIVSDAGFRVPWFQLVESLGWDWLGRVRNRTFVQLAEKDPWVPCKTLYPLATQTPQALGQACMARSNPLACHLVLYNAPPKGRVQKNRLGRKARNARSRRYATSTHEPWLLATSLPACPHFAKQVVARYALRMQIEEAFRDLKSTRFGLALEHHLTQHVERLQVLLLIAALALRVAWVIGKATELTGQQWHYQANTVRRRTVLSTIFIGFTVIAARRATLTAQDLTGAWESVSESIQSYCVFPAIETAATTCNMAA